MKRRSSGVGLEAYSLPGGLLALVVLLLLTDKPALIRELATWQNVAGSSAIGIVVAIAMVLPLRAGEFNLGIGATVGVSAIATAAAFTTYDQPIFVSVLIGIAAGGVMGAISGAFVAYLGVNSLIATLGLGILSQGLVEWYRPGSGFSVINATQLTDLFSKNLPGIKMPAAIIIALVIAAIAYYVIEHVPFGRYLTAIGSNKASATLVGIRVQRTMFIAYVASGLIGGVAGVLVLGSFGSVSAQVMTGAGVTYWLPALAAVYLGATAFQPGRFNVSGAVVAIVLVKLIRTLFTLAKVSEAWPENVVNGAALVLAVAFASYFARRRAGT